MSSPLDTYGREVTERLANLAVDLALTGSMELTKRTTRVSTRYIREVRELLETAGVPVDEMVEANYRRRVEANYRRRRQARP